MPVSTEGLEAMIVAGADPEAGVPADRPWRALLGYTKGLRRVLVLGGTLSLVGGAAGLAQPLAAAAVIDSLGEHRSVWTAVVLLTGLVMGAGVISALGYYLLERTAESVVLAARRQLVGRILRLRMREVDEFAPGDLMSRVTADTTLLRQVTTQSLVQLATNSLMLVGTIVLMAVVDLPLLGVTAAVVAVIGVIAAVMMPRIRQATLRAQEAVGAMGSALERVLGAFRTVKAAGAETHEYDAIDTTARAAWKQGVLEAKWQAIAGTSTGLSLQVAFLAVLGVGGARVASGGLRVAELIAFLLYLFYLAEPLSELVQAISQLQVGAAAVARIQQVDRLPIEPAEQRRGASTRPAQPGPAAIRFDRVWFGYQETDPAVHRNLSFQVPAGSTAAFVGPSGAGKSTIFALLERFFEPNSGKIEVGGRAIDDWKLRRLRAMISYVEQDAPVLSGSLLDNLLLADQSASQEQVDDAVRRARLTSLVERLPAGLDTMVGHRGTRLSGGERQRVAIARAFLRRPRILLMDEATANLDAINERFLIEAIDNLRETTTVLTIAHRLSTVVAADQIIVVNNGTVDAAGTHQDLLASSELYRTLAQTQLLTAESLAGSGPQQTKQNNEPGPHPHRML
ncbi:ABC transporter ATP-binding protein [Fodinicola feengrottensis]|uniref:ABC transporter ATP-binding protein n=1 Tax=Fodinicola feengrottensis TaxID=435914 RepID=A0ABP4UNP3_9ACTN